MEDFIFRDKMLGCYTPYWKKIEDIQKHKFYWIPCPCGKCINCLRNYERSWSFRMRCEMASSKSSYFLTLTYNDFNLPYGSQPSLYKPDYQKFLKRLRKSLHKLVKTIKLRYVCCGEYGGITNRPHYHMAIFLNERIPYDKMYELVHDKWDKGFIQLHYLDKNRIKYLAKYFNKLDERIHDVKTFRTMSNGIGQSFLTPATVKYYKTTKNTVVKRYGYTVGMPRYYKDRIFNERDKKNFIRNFNDTLNSYLDAFFEHHGYNQTPWEHYSQKNKDALDRSRISFGSFCDDDVF